MQAQPVAMPRMEDSSIAVLLKEAAIAAAGKINPVALHAIDAETDMAAAKARNHARSWERNYLRQIWEELPEAKKAGASLKEVEGAFCRAVFDEIQSLLRGRSKNVVNLRELTSPMTEKSARQIWLDDEYQAKFLSAFAAILSTEVQKAAPDMAIPLYLYKDDHSPGRGQVVDASGATHQLMDGIQAARAIERGEVPEIPFCESYLMHAELDRIGVGTHAMNFGYVVYHSDASGALSRVVTQFDYLQSTPRTINLVGWGEKLGEPQLPVPVHFRGLFRRYELTVTLYGDCDGDIGQVTPVCGTYLDPSKIAEVLAFDVRRPSVDTKKTWQGPYSVEFWFVLKIHGVDQTDASTLGLHDQEYLKAIARRSLPGLHVTVQPTVDVVLAEEILEDGDEGERLSAPRN